MPRHSPSQSREPDGDSDGKTSGAGSGADRGADRGATGFWQWQGRHRPTLRRRLTLSHLLVAAFGAVALALVLRVSFFVRNEIVQVAERNAPAAEITLRMLDAFEGSQSALYRWVAVGDSASKDRWRSLWADVIHPGLGALEDMEGRWTHPDDAPLAAQLAETLRELELAQARVVEIAHGPDGQSALREVEAELPPLAGTVRSLLDELSSRQTREMHSEAAQAARLSDTMVVVALLALAACIFTALIASRRAARRITQPVVALSEGALGLIDGSVDAPLPVRGDREIVELVRSFNRLWAALKRGELAVRDEVWAKSEFLAGLSHAIRTPMNGIVGMTELLQLRENDRDRRQQQQEILSSCSSLLGLLNDVFDFSRLEIGRLDLKSSAFSPRSVVRDVLSDLEPAAASRGVTLKAEFDARLGPALIGDSDALRRVLTNAGRHVIGFAADECVTFEVSARENGDGRHELRVALPDVGPRIAPHDAVAIFEPFRRLESISISRSLVTGIELPVAYRLCELMDGEMWLEERGGQDVFQLSLPFPVAAGDELVDTVDGSPLTARAAARRVVPRMSQSDGSGPGRAERTLRILVVEDEAINQRVAMELLELRGHEAVVARTGEEAILRFTENGNAHFDVILMDVQMPVMDGIEATRALRRIEEERGTHTRIIALTAYAQSEDRQRCLDAGMDDYLAKPLHAHDLYERVERGSD